MVCVINVKKRGSDAGFWRFESYIDRRINQKTEMKRIKDFILAVMAVGLMTACGSENGGGMIWDISPVEFDIFITDSEGHDLLDSTYQDNLIKDDIYVSFEGKDYPLLTEQEYYESQQNRVSTRAYLAIFQGLLLRKYWSHKTFTSGDFEMNFGEFDGEESVDRREIILHLPDNKQIRLAYSNSFRWKSNGNPDKNTQFYVNDQELEDEAGRGGYFNFRRTKSGDYEYVPSEYK